MHVYTYEYTYTYRYILDMYIAILEPLYAQGNICSVK